MDTYDAAFEIAFLLGEGDGVTAEQDFETVVITFKDGSKFRFTVEADED